jgi:hypothetical protein
MKSPSIAYCVAYCVDVIDVLLDRGNLSRMTTKRRLVGVWKGSIERETSNQWEETAMNENIRWRELTAFRIDTANKWIASSWQGNGIIYTGLDTIICNGNEDKEFFDTCDRNHEERIPINVCALQ